MAIIQKDPETPNQAISIVASNPAHIQVSSFEFPGGVTQAQQIDLTPYQGGPFRLYLEHDGSLSTDLYADQYWLLAETVLPNKQYDNVPTGLQDENGNDVNELQEAALDLNDINITVFALPVVEPEPEVV
jgi:hypothetical protein